MQDHGEIWVFPFFFCDFIAKLIQSVRASVIVNGFINDSFDVNREVRLGDPLRLHLFLLFLEPFLKMMSNDKHIEGVCIPGSNRMYLKYVAYAHGISLLLFCVMFVWSTK